MEEALLLPEKRESLRTTTWDFLLEAMKKVCYIAIPMIVVNVSRYLIRILSMMMLGHLTELSLSGASIATSLTNVTGFSLLVKLDAPYGCYLYCNTMFSCANLLVMCVHLGFWKCWSCICNWFNLLLLGLYVKYSKSCEKTRLYFSKEEVLASMREFFPLAIPSACMVCLEWWTFEIVILLAGVLPNPQLETSVLSICTRVSNELGAGNDEAAKMTVRAALTISMADAIISGSIFYCCRHIVGYAFSNEKEVVDYISKMTPFLCILMVSDCIQGVLSGVARGSGWQHLGAYVNLGSFYLAGIPTAIICGFLFHLQGKGLWIGLNVGNVLQSLLLSLITSFIDWKKQVQISSLQFICLIWNLTWNLRN
ncbi:hypothetical protein R3W88_007684 [Solanum pinnatisectum]|uniref:Uncharacterized protein n=1 Tax=Solanum pinnatisectum TaxID=50273 RepID=A0AAV9M6J8_9SOLN|nr:hypothetical protein R3W88_007684 [Solanum pinnatisectum]